MNDDRLQLIAICESKLLKLKKDYHKIISEDYEFNLKSKNKYSIFKKARIRKTLPKIAKALIKIKKGTYGVCEKTGEEIEALRLLAIPWTSVCSKAL